MDSTITPALFDRISTALEASPYVPQRRVHVEAEKGNVVLIGHVDSFFQKQMAQEVIRRLDGVDSIENLLEVNWGVSR